MLQLSDQEFKAKNTMINMLRPLREKVRNVREETDNGSREMEVESLEILNLVKQRQ